MLRYHARDVHKVGTVENHLAEVSEDGSRGVSRALKHLGKEILVMASLLLHPLWPIWTLIDNSL